jgi:hypothetical protein
MVFFVSPQGGIFVKIHMGVLGIVACFVLAMGCGEEETNSGNNGANNGNNGALDTPVGSTIMSCLGPA